MLLLRDADVERAVLGDGALKRAIDIIEQSFAAVASGEATVGARQEIFSPPGSNPSTQVASLATSWAIIPSLGLSGGRLLCQGVNAVVPADAHAQWTVLFDIKTTDIAAFIETRSVHKYMVGSSAAVGTRWLSRADSHTVGLIGSGGMARACLRSICAVRSITSVRIFSPNREHRERLAAECREMLGIDVEAAPSAEAAVREADIVCTATTNEARRHEPSVYKAEWLKPGTHVTSIGDWEVDEASILHGTIFPASADQARRPRWEPLGGMMERGEMSLDKLGTPVSELVQQQRSGRTSDDQLTVYLSASIATHNVALAAWVLREAQTQGIGHTWELD